LLTDELAKKEEEICRKDIDKKSIESIAYDEVKSQSYKGGYNNSRKYCYCVHRRIKPPPRQYS
jgi:hypothetical protein